MITSSLPTQALKRMLGFPLRDTEARNKLFVAMALSLASKIVPLVPLFFLAGYCMRLMRPIIDHGAEAELPAWEDWTGLLKDGARMLLASLVWTLPGMLVVVVGYGVYFSPIVMGIIEGASGGSDVPSVAGMLTAYGVGFVLMIAGMLLLVILACLQPLVLSHVAATGSFRKAFALRELVAVFRANSGGWVLVMLLLFCLIAGSWWLIYLLQMTLVLCCLTPFLSAALTGWFVVIAAALSASAYRESVA